MQVFSMKVYVIIVFLAKFSILKYLDYKVYASILLVVYCKWCKILNYLMEIKIISSCFITEVPKCKL